VLLVGDSYSGLIAEIVCVASSLSGTNLGYYRDYVATRFGISL
jgi:hypothetical protein